MVFSELTGVLNEGDPAVFVTDNEIEFTVLIPIERHGGNHLQIHGQRTR